MSCFCPIKINYKYITTQSVCPSVDLPLWSSPHSFRFRSLRSLQRCLFFYFCPIKFINQKQKNNQPSLQARQKNEAKEGCGEEILVEVMANSHNECQSAEWHLPPPHDKNEVSVIPVDVIKQDIIMHFLYRNRTTSEVSLKKIESLF